MSEQQTASRTWTRTPGLALVTAIVLVVAGLSMAVYNEHVYKIQKAREVSVQAQIVADSVTAALAFDDANAAQEYLGALRANPEVEAAGVYDQKGKLVARYSRGGVQPPVGVSLRAPAFNGPHLTVTAPVAQNGTKLGAVYLQAVTEPTTRRAARYIGVALLVLMASLVLAVLGAATAALRRANTQLEDRADELAQANNNLLVQIEERGKAEEALRQSQKMEAIGQLTGGVAHDFNNLLMVATSGLDLMDRTQDPARLKLLKDGVRQAVERGATLTRQLLAFSRRTPLKPEVIDLGERIDGMKVLLDRSLREDINVEIRLEPGLWAVEIDPGQLEVALLNIALNARDAMPNGGLIVIAGTNRPDFDAHGLKGDFVELSVTDAGQGMAPEMIIRAFEPFFTTKGVGKGTGLGLSQVYGFTRASGGDVTIASELGHGATVSLLLPRSTKPLPPKPQAAPPADEGSTLKGRLLLVEDDDGVAAVVTEMLTELGYQVRRAPAPAAALAALESDPAFDMVFSDIVMPGGMNGIELAREIRRLRPELPILLTTGYSERASAAQADGLHLLLKPYGIDALAAELSAARREHRRASH